MDPAYSNRRNRHTELRAPFYKRAYIRVRDAFLKRPLLIGASLLIFGVVFASAVHIQQRTTARNATQSQLTDVMIENLEYQTVLPENRTISQLGGWRRVSPANENPVYAYSDRIDGVAINVSQQPLPASFIGKSEQQVSELAKAYSATTELSADDTKFYTGISSKGPQSVIFTKNNLLIMIKAEEKIPNESWIQYISKLQ